MSAPAPKSRSIARLAVRSTLWVSLGSYASIGLGFVSNLALTRLLPPEAFGLFALASFWSGLLNLRGKAGLSQAAIQHPRTDGQLLGTYWAVDAGLTALGMALTAGMVALLPGLLGYAPEVQIAILALTAIDGLTLLFSPIGMLLDKELLLSRSTLIGLLGYAAGYAAAIGLALSGVHTASLFAINLSVNLVSIGGLHALARRRLPEAYSWNWRADAGLARQLLRRGLPIGLSLTAAVVTSQFDNFLVGTLIGTQMLGLYDRAFRTAQWANLLLTTVISRVAFITFARVQDDRPRLTHAVRLAFWLLLMLGLPITLVLVWRPAEIVMVLYGERYAESAQFLPYLALSALAGPFMAMSVALANALGRSRAAPVLTLIQAASTVALVTPLTLLYGVMGTVAGVCLTAALTAVLSGVYVFRESALTFTEVLQAPILASASAAAALLALEQLGAWSGLPPLMRLALTGLVVGLVYYGTYFIQRPAEMRDRLHYLRQVWRGTSIP